MQSGQDKIYYLLGADRAGAAANPNLEYFGKKEIEVLLLIDPVDVFTISGLTKYKDFEIISVERADIEEDSDDSEDGKKKDDSDSKELIKRFKTVLGDRVEDVVISKRLVDSAATLVAGESGMDAQMERMMRMMDENFSGAKKVLEINLKHVLITNLASLQNDDSKSELTDKTIVQIFEGSQLLEGVLDSPSDFVERMTKIMVQATETEE